MQADTLNAGRAATAAPAQAGCTRSPARCRARCSASWLRSTAAGWRARAAGSSGPAASGARPCRRDGCDRSGFEHALRREALQGVMERRDAWWCDDKSTPAVETASRSTTALARAPRRTASRPGLDGRLALGPRAPGAQRAPPVQQGARAGKGVRAARAGGGDTYTVNVSRVNLKPDLTTGELLPRRARPPLRAALRPRRPANSRFMHPRAIGHRARRTTAASVERWTKVDYAPLWSAPTVQTLLFQPAK